MLQHEHLVLCGGLGRADDQDTDKLRLNRYGPFRNVRLQTDDISRRLLEEIPDELADLLDIAAYVYAADSAISRGGPTDAQMGQRWRRRFQFVVPVRKPHLWSRQEITTALAETLSFLSDDDYRFDFVLLRERPTIQTYAPLRPKAETSFTPNAVILFSGGLDSFAGTVEELVAYRKSVVLVSHRSSSKIVDAQDYLVQQLRARLGSDRVFHVPVWADLAEDTTREFTHRTRSFLFATLGAVTARLFGVDQITFFENGVLSLNLPTLGQIVGGRATRTTHPQALVGFRRILSLVVGQRFDVDNPYRWLTKAEVIRRIRENGFVDLIRRTRSCARIHTMTKLHPHCGRCSQCIDRRFAVLAAGLEEEDPAEAYKVDLFTGERPAGPDRELALAYVRSASDIERMTELDFFSRYGEASRAVGFFDEPAETVARRIYDLHRQHATWVCRVFEQAITSYRTALLDGSLSPFCLLTLVVGQHDRFDAYPEQIQAVQEPIAPTPRIRMAIDGKRVVFDRWGEITGVGAELLIALAGPFRVAMRAELVPENYPFIVTHELLVLLKCPEEETLRRRVSRCRGKIKQLAMEAEETAPSIDAVVESTQRRGYRLNPDSVRIVALSELTQRK